MGSDTEGLAVVLGLTHGGLAIVRSLARRGVRVIGATYERDEFGCHSRYLSDLVDCPHPRDQDAFIDFLRQKSEAWGGAYLFDTNDYFVEVLARYKPELSRHYRIGTPDWDRTQVFLDKQLTYRLAARCGVPHPRIHEVEPDLDPATAFEQARGRMDYPIMLKPTRSHEFAALFGAKNLIAADDETLQRALRTTIEAGQPVVLSEVIPGTDRGTLERVQLYINSLGEVAASFANVKLRQTPPMFGVMRVGRSTEPNPEVEAYALELLRAIDYQGFASVEFKRDYRDGELKLMEVNVRLPRSIPLPIRAGVDFPWLVYRDLVDDVQLRVDAYDTSTYLIEQPTDLIDFVRYDRDRLRNLGTFLGPYRARTKTWGVAQRDDLGPFLKALRTRGRTGVRVAGRLAASVPSSLRGR